MWYHKEQCKYKTRIKSPISQGFMRRGLSSNWVLYISFTSRVSMICNLMTRDLYGLIQVSITLVVVVVSFISNRIQQWNNTRKRKYFLDIHKHIEILLHLSVVTREATGLIKLATLSLLIYYIPVYKWYTYVECLHWGVIVPHCNRGNHIHAFSINLSYHYM